MKAKKIFIQAFTTFAFVVLSLFSNAQIVQGTVTDQDGDPVSFVAVFVKGTSYGVLTNGKGEYVLELASGEHTVVFQMSGFREEERKITVNGPIKLNMKLIIEDEVLDMVVVKSDREDPAYEIIRSAISKRKMYKEKLKTLKSDAYIRAVLEYENLKSIDTVNDELITRKRVNLIESQSKVYYVAPNRFKEVKSAYRDLAENKSQTTGVSVGMDVEDGRNRRSIDVTNPLLFFTNVNDGNFDFYRNLLDLPTLSESPYTSPISSNAFLVYRFKFIESFIEENRLVFKIQVIPRFKGGKLFQGIIYIEDISFGIKAVDLELNPYSLKFFSKFRLIQDYHIQGDSVIYPSRQEFYYETRQSQNKTSYGKTIVKYENHEINPKISRRFMSQGQTIYTDSSYERNEDYWSIVRPFSLKPVEAKFIKTRDSIRLHRSSAEFLARQDSVYNNLNVWNFLLNGIVHKNFRKKTSWFIYPLIAQIQVNLVDGYRHTLGGAYNKEWVKANELELNGNISYGLINKNVRGELSARYLYQPKKFERVRLKYSNQYTMLTTYESIYGTFAPRNFVENEGIGIGHEKEWWNGFFLKAYLDYNQFRPYDGEILAEVWKGLNGVYSRPREFESFKQLVLDLTADITFKQQYDLKPHKKIIRGSKYPTIRVHYKKGIKPFLNSDVNYDFLEIGTDHDFKLATAGLSRISVRTGRFLNSNSIRLSDLKYFRGSDKYFFSNPLRSLQQISRTSMSTSEAYFRASYIHHFNGALLGKIPLLNRWSIQTAGGSSLLLMEKDNTNHLELFVGLEKPFRLWHQLFRVSAFYVASQSSEYGTNGGFKFGIDFYNSVSRSWMY